MTYEVIDKRGGKNKPPEEACRVCGSSVAHSKTYNTPTMECIKYLRGKIEKLEKRILALKTVAV